MSRWRVRLSEALRSGIKYCFKPVSGTYPELDEEEFSGRTEDGKEEPGFVDFIASVVYAEQKRLFFRAYELGARDCMSDMKDTTPIQFEFNEDANRVGAWKRWDEVQREGE